MTDRTLVLLRHSKAANPEHVADLQRPLSPQGHADAEAAGSWLATERLVPDLVLCSPARRTRETWHGVAVALGGEATGTTVAYEPALYQSAGARELLDLIRETGPEVATLVMIGHNPTLSMLSSLLDFADEGLRTSGIAVHRVPGSWRDLSPGKAVRTASHTARG
jgi:phosphohistidine phosphatase